MNMWLVAVLTLVILVVGLFIFNQYKFSQAEKTFPPNGEFIVVDGVKLHYIRRGQGRPVVFLHGGVLDGNDFKEVIDLAAGQGFLAIAFDRPGYGYSERPSHERMTPLAQARLIHEALRQLGIEKPIIVGHSWSGTMSLLYAHHYPNDISGIVLLAAAMYKEGYPAEHGDPISKLVTTPIIGSIVMHILLKSPLGIALTKMMLKQTFAPEPVPGHYREAALALWLRPGQFRANREDILAFPPAAKEAAAYYHQLKTLIVAMYGTEDPFGVSEQAARLKKDIPHTVLKVIPEVSHMIPQNHPTLVMEAIHEVIRMESWSQS
ncbi:alpha/beta fold hydrolase [Marinicrinis lubricantis]|uniref:Alpha/beta fold hydrolase n=1 Tax=Marinicrinis lubricantis TaxID=2086470 RepID=A0ABW1IRV6_9BACL